MAPKKVVKSETPVTAPTSAPTETKSRSKKTEEKPAATPAPEQLDDTEGVEKKRRVVNKDTVNEDFESLLARIGEEINKIKSNGEKAKGIKVWKTINKLARQLQHDTNKVTKFKTSNRKVNTTSGFLKPVKISSEMSTFTAWDPSKTYSRTEVTRFICNYIKEKNLNDQSDKRNINCDAKLKKLLKYDPADPKLPKDENGKTLPLTYFRLQQYLKHHFIKVENDKLDA